MAKKKRHRESVEQYQPNSFQVVEAKWLSVADLEELQDQGYPILRSAHLGNQYASNMALMQEEIPTILYDKTFMTTDGNYNPSLVLTEEKCHDLFWGRDTPNKLTPMMPLPPEMKFSRNINGKIGELLQDSVGVAELHYKSLQKVFPDTDIKTFSGWFLENKAVVTETLETLVEHLSKDNPEELVNVFNRYILPDGEPLPFTEIRDSKVVFGETVEVAFDDLVDGFWKVTQGLNDLVVGNLPTVEEFKEVKSATEWPLISNHMNVVFYAVIDLLKSGKKEVFHCWGPDMFYTLKGDNNKIYDLLYGIVKDNSNLELPDQFVFNLVPTALGKMYSLSQVVSDKIEKLCIADREKEMLAKRKGGEIKRLMQQGGMKTKEIVGMMRNWVYGELEEYSTDRAQEVGAGVIAGFCPDYMFDHINTTRRYFTQYDLLGINEEEKAAVFNNAIRTVSYEGLKKINTFLNGLNKKMQKERLKTESFKKLAN